MSYPVQKSDSEWQAQLSPGKSDASPYLDGSSPSIHDIY